LAAALGTLGSLKRRYDVVERRTTSPENVKKLPLSIRPGGSRGSHPEGRLDEARRTVDRSSVIYSRARDTTPIDRVKFLNLRGVLHARFREWQQSEQDLSDAASMMNRQPSVDPALHRLLLTNYSYVLRKRHRAREARSVKARIAELPKRSAGSAVDNGDLFVGR
jgi:hypothetical protein